MNKFLYFLLVMLIQLQVAIAEPLCPNLEISKDHSRYVEVMIGEFGIYRPSQEVDGILTQGLESCIGLILYHRSSQVGLVAHFWPFKDVRESFMRIKSRLDALGLKYDEFDAYIQNGNHETLVQVSERIIQETKKLGVRKILVSIYGTDTYKGNNSPNLSLDLHTDKMKGFNKSTRAIRTNASERIERYLNNREGPLDPAPESL